MEMIHSLISKIIEDKPIEISDQLLFHLGQITLEEFNKRQEKIQNENKPKVIKKEQKVR